MRIKVFLSLLIAIALLTATASAQSLFDAVPSGKQSSKRPAPSLGSICGNMKKPDISANKDGDTVLTYGSVYSEYVNNFGIFLDKLAYEVTAKETQGSQTAYALSDGSIEFTMIYDSALNRMTIVYPKGTDYELTSFSGRGIPLMLGEKIEFGSLTDDYSGELLDSSSGIMTFSNFVLGTKVEQKWCADYDLPSDKKYSGATIDFSFYNSSPYESDCPLSAKLYYINSDNSYEYKLEGYGFRDGEKLLRENGSKIPSLTTAYLCAGFELPEVVQTSTGGTLGINISVQVFSDYFILLRWHGVDLY